VTNQEAINLIIKCTTFDCEHCNKCFKECKDKDKFDEMKIKAITALEQQLTGGWIPDIMKEVLGEEATDIILSNPDEFKKWLKRGIWNCKRLNELSNCKNVWISVAERLPEENGHYLVTYHEWSKGEYLPEFDFTCVKILRFYHGEFNMPVCCNDKIEQDIGREVLAWRELPEIWKEDNDAERHISSGLSA